MLAGGPAANQNNPSEDRDLVERLASAPARQVFKIETTPADDEKAKQIIKEFRECLNKGNSKKPQ